LLVSFHFFLFRNARSLIDRQTRNQTTATKRQGFFAAAAAAAPAPAPHLRARQTSQTNQRHASFVPTPWVPSASAALFFPLSPLFATHRGRGASMLEVFLPVCVARTRFGGTYPPPPHARARILASLFRSVDLAGREASGERAARLRGREGGRVSVLCPPFAPVLFLKEFSLHPFD
jgi:hypothetical protein